MRRILRAIFRAVVGVITVSRRTMTGDFDRELAHKRVRALRSGP